MATNWIEASDEPETSPTKRAAVVGTAAKQLELQHLILSLQNAQMTRQLTGAVFWTVMIPISMGKDALAATKAFALKAKESKNHKMGSPHIQLWRTLVKTVLSMSNQEKSLAEHVTVLEKYLKAFQDAGPENGHQFVAQARIKQIRDDSKLILLYSLSTMLEPSDRWRVDKAIHTILLFHKCEIKPGTAPPSEAEKKIQQAVDQLRAELNITKNLSV